MFKDIQREAQQDTICARKRNAYFNVKPRVPHGDPRNSDIQSEPDSVEYFRSFCNMLKNDVNELFNYVCNDVLIDDFKYMTVECK